MMGVYLNLVSLSWAELRLNDLPFEMQVETLLNYSIKDIDQTARSYRFLRNVILSEDFYTMSKFAWLEKGSYQNLVNFPQYLILREIKKNFNNLEWRKKAVHMLLDAKTQFAEIPAGTFQMGSPISDSTSSRDELQHWVKLSSPVWMQRVEFTQLLLVLVTGENNSHFKGKEHCPEDHLILETHEGKVSLCPRNPAERVSWYDITEKDESGHAKQNTVIGILRDQFGINTRLPTEAEWERAARGLSETYQSYSFGELAEDQSNLKVHAWYNSSSGDRTHRVAVKQPNAFGLFDVYGNVWEWAEDLYGNYSDASDQNTPWVDPVGKVGFNRVLRGGCWNDGARSLRSAYRYYALAGFRWNDVGFRLVRMP
jgi:formylglycine-generating enzyme required for sulfatase activity